MESSYYIEQERRDYALYILHNRAIPSLSDGLKAAARRVLWTARDGKKWKTSSLAGATMPIHPHGEPSGTINTLTAFYGNNIPLFTGIGAFGTLLIPNEYGAPRYTSVYLSSFTKDVIFADQEIIPLKDNYDGTLQEPKHFLPLIPVVLLNPQEGIAVGFASNILPRSLSTIINDQINYLANKPISPGIPTFLPTNNNATDIQRDKNNKQKFKFDGDYEVVSATTIRVTKLPYGMLHEKFIDNLNKLLENEQIQAYNDKSSDNYDITIKVKKGTNLKDKVSVIESLNLTNWITENLNVLNFNEDYVINLSYEQLIKDFTDWRFSWYLKRYERLRDILEDDIVRYSDLILAIDKKIGDRIKEFTIKQDIITWLTKIKVVNTDYIAGLPVYRFTKEERDKTAAKLKDALELLEEYESIINNEPKRKQIYIKELKEVSKKYG